MRWRQLSGDGLSTDSQADLGSTPKNKSVPFSRTRIQSTIDREPLGGPLMELVAGYKDKN